MKIIQCELGLMRVRQGEGVGIGRLFELGHEPVHGATGLGSIAFGRRRRLAAVCAAYLGVFVGISSIVTTQVYDHPDRHGYIKPYKPPTTWIHSLSR